MFHYAHQPVSDWVCLLFGAEQVAYGGFLLLFLWTQLPAAAEDDAVRAARVNRNSKVAAGQLNYELKLTIKLATDYNVSNDNLKTMWQSCR